ncbi:hypothetical protein [Marinoscillum sp.]|uniref:hypothetical protein n=1 Tax=Marinoscillum sp. TaxID=2024838 RepID=UPI003BAC9CF0
MKKEQSQFIQNLLNGSREQPPASCMDTFRSSFTDAIAQEWSLVGEHYEVVFYRNSLEHTARFTQNGVLLDYRLKLTADLLPPAILKTVRAKGELMNSVLMNMGRSIVYEMIIRDSNLNRYQLELNELGEVLAEHQL